MHYYERNIGDYYRKAGRLNILQHGVYTLLIDACYDREQFPTHQEAIEWVWAESDEEIKAVEFVLRKFFKLNEDGQYIQNHIAEDLEAYQSFIAKQSENGKKGGRPKNADKFAKSSLNSETQNNPVKTQNNPNEANESLNQEPITNNHNINTLSLSADEFSPPLDLVNTKLKMSGLAETNQTELNQILVQFNLKTSHLQMVDNQKLGSLLTWFKNERQQTKPNARASPSKPLMDFDSLLAAKNQMRDVIPTGVIHHEQ